MRKTTFVHAMSLVVAFGLAFGLASSALAVLPVDTQAQGAPLADFDLRPGLGSEAAPTPAQLSDLGKLRAAASASGPGSEIVVRWGGVPGTIHHLFRRGGFLSGPSPAGETPSRTALQFLGQHAELLGLSRDSVARLELRGVVVDPLTNAAHVVVRQRVDGIPIFQSALKVNLDRDGRVLSVAGNSALEGILPGERVLSAETALVLAARSLGLTLDSAPARAASRVGDAKDEIRFERGIFKSEPWGHPRWMPRVAGARGAALAPAWVMFVDPAGDQGWYQVVVDARTGEMLARFNLVQNAATEGLVFREDPGQGPQVTLPFVDDTEVTHAASPLGWSAAGLSEGNNCDSKDDRANDNEGTDGQRAVALVGPPMAFPFPFTNDTSVDLNAALTNAFYVNNWLHDRLVLMGFDEQSGNFQLQNFSGAGLGNDRVFVDVQDGSGTNNANFGTPPDGSNPRMQMYIWTYTNPARDSSFDASVITHELFHGVSNRLVGLLQNDGGCLGGPQGGAMGEGWSDYFACSFWNQVTVGGYLVNNYIRGIRRAAYDSYPYDYAQLCNQGGFQVHRDGEIWVGTLWHVRQLFIDKYGFQRGRCAFDRLLLDGMKLAPCLPNYVDMRDAILLAAQLHGADGDQCLLWQGFADRGLGVGAIGRPDCTSAADASYAVPAECATCASFAAPAAVTFDTSSPNRVVATFTASPGATEHLLLRAPGTCPGDCLDAEFIEVARGAGDATQLVDADSPTRPLSAGDTFAYRVTALQGACTASSACTEVAIVGRCTLRPLAGVEGSVGVKSLARPPGSTCSVIVSWEPMRSACAPYASLRYNIYRSTDSAFVPGPENLLASVAEPARSFTDMSVPPANVTYVVRAEDLTVGGEGPHGGNEEANSTRQTLSPQGLPSGSGTFADDAESGELPGYRRTGSYNPNDWAIVSDGNTRSGSAWHVTDVEGGNADKNLHLPPLSLGSTAPRLTFSHVFQFEAEFDGGVLEISVDGGNTWRDLKDDITVGGYNSFSYTVTDMMHAPNTDRLWTGQNPSGFPNYDAVEVNLSPYAGTLDAQLRLRALVDPSAAEPGGWYVDDLRVEDIVTFGACASGCITPPQAMLTNALACTNSSASIRVTLDGSASLAGAAGFASELGWVFTHDGPGSFAGRRWASGSVATLEFPSGTPAGDYPVTLTVRGADGCSDQAAAVVQLRDETSVPASVGDTLRVRKLGSGLELRWTDVGASATNVHVVPLGSYLAALELTSPVQRVSGGPVVLIDGLAATGAGTAYIQVFSSSDCGRSVR